MTVRPRTAAIRREVTDLTLTDSFIGTTSILRVMREGMVRDLRELLPHGRIYFAASKTASRTLCIDALVSEDDTETLRLIQRLRSIRKQWHGYRTDLDWAKETQS